jgi:excisionase family DNA binding protein
MILYDKNMITLWEVFEMKKEQNLEHEFLTAEEAAQLLRISAKHLRDLAREGRVPGRKVGREWRFSRTALIEWMSGK